MAASPTVATLSNAMDVSQPNNWPRVEELFKCNGWSLSELGSNLHWSDKETRKTLRAQYAKGYLCEPHEVCVSGAKINYRLMKQVFSFVRHIRQKFKKALTYFKSRAYASGNIG